MRKLIGCFFFSLLCSNVWAEDPHQYPISNWVNWPIAGLLLGLVIIFVFRKDTSSLLNRVRQITLPNNSGLMTDASQQSALTSDKTSFEKLMLVIPETALLHDQEERISSDLTQRNVTDPVEINKILLRHLAWTQIKLRFEILYTSIYGSQLSILVYLNSYPKEDTIQVIKRYYDSACEKNPATFQNYTFEQYLDFLTSSNLVIRKDDKYVITVLGREFLAYLISNGLTLSRPN